MFLVKGSTWLFSRVPRRLAGSSPGKSSAGAFSASQMIVTIISMEKELLMVSCPFAEKLNFHQQRKLKRLFFFFLGVGLCSLTKSSTLKWIQEVYFEQRACKVINPSSARWEARSRLSSASNRLMIKTNPVHVLLARCRCSLRQRLGLLNSCLRSLLHDTAKQQVWTTLRDVVKCKKKNYPCHFTIIAEDATAFLMSGPSASRRIAKKLILGLFSKVGFQLIVILKNHTASVCESWV